MKLIIRKLDFESEESRVERTERQRCVYSALPSDPSLQAASLLFTLERQNFLSVKH